MCSLRTLRPAPAFPRRLRNATKQAATHIVTKTSINIRLERRERAAAAACGRRALREGAGTFNLTASARGALRAWESLPQASRPAG